MSEIMSHRRISWTKNTNYVSVAAPRAPMEVGSHAHAPNKSVEQELENNKHRIEQIHRKSLVMMAGQRKLLEKSMLAYTEKMKQINENRTSELFREIQSRNGATSRSLPDIHKSPEPLEEVHQALKARKRHKVMHRTSVSNGTRKNSSAESGEETVAAEGKKTDFAKLRSLLRRSSTADLIHEIKLKQEMSRAAAMERFASTQSLIETADYLRDYRQCIVPEEKNKIFPDKKKKHKLNVEAEVKHEHVDSAYNSGIDSHDDFSESDTVIDSHEDSDSKMSDLKSSKKTLVRKGGKVSTKAKPKLIRKGRKLLKKMNTENSHSTDSLLKTAIMSTASKYSDSIPI